jgi:alkaline phosphatase D
MRWLELPKENRPHFSTLYFSKVDSAGHAFGPGSSQVEKTLQKLDKDIGTLIHRLERLDFPVNIVITSDHGMTDLSFSKIAYLDEHFTKKKDEEIWDRFEVVHTFALAFFYYKGPKENKKTDIKRALELLNKHPRYATYQRGNLPKHLYFNENPRMGDLVAIADTGWTIGPKSEIKVIPGSHGFDPEETLDMDGIFIANGPLFKANQKIERFENIHIYPFLAKLLGLSTKGIPIDGSPEILEAIIRKK